MDKKDNKFKSLKMYGILCFIGVILIIIISTISFVGTGKRTENDPGVHQNPINQTMETGVVELVKERDKIVEKNVYLEEIVKEERAKNAKLIADTEIVTANRDAMEYLIFIANLVNSGEMDKAKTEIVKLDVTKLNEVGVELYNTIKGEIENA